MTVITIAILVAVVYVCVITFVLAMLKAAKRADEAPRAADADNRRFGREDELELTPEDAAFLERLSRR